MNHYEKWQKLCPGKLSQDREWAPVAFIFASDSQLEKKAAKHMYPKLREIDWLELMQEDFGSGHRAIVHLAFTLWAGNAWKWDDKGNQIAPIDVMDLSYSMDEPLLQIALKALAWRWLNERPWKEKGGNNSMNLATLDNIMKDSVRGKVITTQAVIFDEPINQTLRWPVEVKSLGNSGDYWSICGRGTEMFLRRFNVPGQTLWADLTYKRVMEWSGRNNIGWQDIVQYMEHPNDVDAATLAAAINLIMKGGDDG